MIYALMGVTRVIHLCLFVDDRLGRRGGGGDFSKIFSEAGDGGGYSGNRMP